MPVPVPVSMSLSLYISISALSLYWRCEQQIQEIQKESGEMVKESESESIRSISVFIIMR